MVILLSRLLGVQIPREPMPFLLLPVELRLEIYKHLVEPVTHTLKDPKLRSGVLTVHDKTCDMSILRTCKTIHDEAKPAIIDVLRTPEDEPAYHFFTNRWPAVEQFVKINHVRFGLIDFIDDSSLRQVAARARHLSKGTSLRIDYSQHPRVSEWDYQQDLALLESATKRAGNSINILHSGRLMPLSKYLSEEPPASEALRQERNRWKLNFNQWGWLWDEPRIAELGNNPLPPWIRLPSERMSFGEFVRRFLSYEKGLALCLLGFACYGIFAFFRLCHSLLVGRSLLPSFAGVAFFVCNSFVIGWFFHTTFRFSSIIRVFP
ncbi:hypothetical protein K505DRAFT_327504 [Melanomma pulvis-pyrius CBS 109.77]|uniref:Uncharacterized protein n=1 Tax=Melanomma pulvis-pyrius CBS 109.77 TaxID=1314802 RepID=A0A6A6X331_9PLEO|nr:hypothetical protein K505DRAFT_327504 [Melanomma pulvis-pyrius CBS 109.77]